MVVVVAVLLVAGAAAAYLLLLKDDGGGPSGRDVDRTGFQQSGKIWPLTVRQGRIECRGGDALVFTSPDGRQYALNDVAQVKLALPAIEPIWTEDSSAAGKRVDLSDLLGAAQAEC
ncbi:DUF2511 domain-containing protein [Yinghuangia seranimata]|uniref:DUF2511 domain-containing protein n=1 Tax=Yinghuangia seranimata TaxID=408067 RepID=UPI00248C7959|nr:DUF2511 domain-containing protein [Yinghuangia seranimata]MDI2127529.1 DUF2511 domain-containing protein [Yinghuangia seranimata]